MPTRNTDTTLCREALGWLMGKNLFPSHLKTIQTSSRSPLAEKDVNEILRLLPEQRYASQSCDVMHPDGENRWISEGLGQAFSALGFEIVPPIQHL